MITERQLLLLDFIIEEYINSAKPIGSALVAVKSGFGLSPATIRNEMNELEHSGLLIQLHTSGGRVPTDRAYRQYVDRILSEHGFELANEHKRLIRNAIVAGNENPQAINKNIAQVLSKISENLVITGISQNEDFYKTGLASLFEMPEFKEFDRVFNLTSFFDEFDRTFARIEQDLFGVAFPELTHSMNIFIGRENPVKKIRDETVMCAKYNLPNNFTGSLTLIGPTRMDYRRNISLLQFIVDELNKST